MTSRTRVASHNPVLAYRLKAADSESRERLSDVRHRLVNVQRARVVRRLGRDVDVDVVLVDRKPRFRGREPGVGLISGPLHRRPLRVPRAELDEKAD